MEKQANKRITSSNQIICKVKHDSWGDYETVDSIPTTFLDLVKLFSQMYFPYNFSINYVTDDFTTIPVDNSQTYKTLIKFIRQNRKKEIKFFVNIYKEKEEERSRKNSVIAERPKTAVQKKGSFKVFNLLTQTIKEIEEYSSNISEESCCSTSSLDESLCVKEGMSKNEDIKEKEENNEVFSKDSRCECIYCY